MSRSEPGTERTASKKPSSFGQRVEALLERASGPSLYFSALPQVHECTRRPDCGFSHERALPHISRAARTKQNHYNVHSDAFVKVNLLSFSCLTLLAKIKLVILITLYRYFVFILIF